MGVILFLLIPNMGFLIIKKEDVWMYQEKPIHFLFDKETITFIDNSSFALESGWLLKVIRSTDGNIEGLTEMTQAEVDAVFN